MINPVQHRELSANIIEKQFREACQSLSIDLPMSRDASNFKVMFDFVNLKKSMLFFLLK